LQVWGVLDRCISKVEASEARVSEKAVAAKQKADRKIAEKAAKHEERELERKKALEHVKIQVPPGQGETTLTRNSETL
jgi:hypothetical protein